MNRYWARKASNSLNFSYNIHNVLVLFYRDFWRLADSGSSTEMHYTRMKYKTYHILKSHNLPEDQNPPLEHSASRHEHYILRAPRKLPKPWYMKTVAARGRWPSAGERSLPPTCIK